MTEDIIQRILGISFRLCTVGQGSKFLREVDFEQMCSEIGLSPKFPPQDEIVDNPRIQREVRKIFLDFLIWLLLLLVDFVVDQKMNKRSSFLAVQDSSIGDIVSQSVSQ